MAYGGAYIPNLQAEKQVAENAIPQQPATSTGDPNVGRPTSFWARLAKDGAAKTQQLLQIGKSMGQQLVQPIVDTGKQIEKQAKYLAGPTATQAQQQSLLKSQNTAQSRMSSATKSLMKQASASGKVKANQMVSSGASDQTVQAFLKKDSQAMTKNTEKMTGNAAQIALLAVGGPEAKSAGTLLKSVGEQGVKDLAARAGVDASVRGVGKDGIEAVAKAVAKTSAGKQVLSEIAKQEGSTVLKRAATSAGKNAVGFGAFGAAGALSEGKNTKEALKQGAENAAVGAVAGVGGSLLKSAVKGVTSKVGGKLTVDEIKSLIDRESTRQTAQKMADTHGLPAGNIPKSLNSAERKLLPEGKSGPDTVKGGETYKPSGQDRGFTITAPKKGETPEQYIARSHIDHIDQQLRDMQVNGTTKSASEVRAMIRDKQALADIHSGSKSVSEGLSAIKDSAIKRDMQGLDQTQRLKSAAAKVENPTIEESVSKPKAEKTSAALTDSKDEINHTLENAKVASIKQDKQGVTDYVRKLFNPAPGKEGKGVKSDFRAMLGKFTNEKGSLHNQLKSDLMYFDRQSVSDNLKFIQNRDIGATESNPEMQKRADFYRQWFEGNKQIAQKLKPNSDFNIENYFSHAGMFAPEKAKSFADRFQKLSMTAAPGSLKEREFPTVYDAVKSGVPIKEANPAKIALNTRVSLLQYKLAQDFMKEQEAKGADMNVVHDVVNRYLESGMRGNPLFHTASQAAGKVVQSVLAFSGFHYVSTGLDAAFTHMGQGINDALSGHPIQGIGKVVTAPAAPFRYVFSGAFGVGKEARAGVSNELRDFAERANFNLFKDTNYETSSLKGTMSSIIGDIKTSPNLKTVAGAPIRTVAAAAQVVSKPLMEWWVPNMRTGAFYSLAKDELARAGADITDMQKNQILQHAADEIDNRFGEMNKDNLMWNHTMTDMMHLGMISPSWNIGTGRVIGGGALSLAKPSTYRDLLTLKGLPPETAYTISLATGVAMIGTAMTYMATGRGPQSYLDYFFPPTGKTNKSGDAERVGLPTYINDVAAFLHNPEQSLLNKGNPLLNEISQLNKNQNYYGNEIRNPEDSAGTQIKQLAKFLVQNNLPFSFQGSNQSQSPVTKVENFFGIKTAPGYITKSKFEQDVQSSLNRVSPMGSQTPEQVQAAQANAAQGKTASGKPQTGTTVSREFKMLMSYDRAEAARVLKEAGPQDIQKLGGKQALIDKLQSSINRGTAKPATMAASRQMLSLLEASKKY